MRTAGRISLSMLAMTFAAGSPAQAQDNRAVTQEQFKKLVKVFKNVVDRFDRLERKVDRLSRSGAGTGSKPNGEEEAVDLADPGVKSVNEPPVSTPGGHGRSAHRSSFMPNFKVFFDLNLVNRPGISDLTFDNFHSLLLFDLLPSADLQFSFDINPTPRYYELDYQITPWLQLRAGKIWIPFDDLAPHNIFGGRVNVSRLSLGAAFLPDLWTDLGVGAKFQIMDRPQLSLVGHLYIVNGFRAGGTDPRIPGGGPEIYPSFSDLPTSADNNRDKAIGGRIHALFFQTLGIGASVYTGRWTSESQDSRRMNIFGVDSQLRFKKTELRGGYAGMSVQLPGDSMIRGGFYGEAGQKFGAQDEWKVLLRGGMIQLDDRVLDVTDQTIVGGTLLFKPGLIQYSIEYSQDLHQVAGKKNYSYTALRLVVAL